MGFKMSLTETMKYGDINVHSDKWVKYHTPSYREPLPAPGTLPKP